MKNSSTCEGGTVIEKGKGSVRVHGDSEVIQFLADIKDENVITLRRHVPVVKEELVSNTKAAVMDKKEGPSKSSAGVKTFFTSHGTNNKSSKKRVFDDAANTSVDTVEKTDHKRVKQEETPIMNAEDAVEKCDDGGGGGPMENQADKSYHLWKSDADPKWILLRWCLVNDGKQIKLQVTDGERTWGDEMGQLWPQPDKLDNVESAYLDNTIQALRGEGNPMRFSIDPIRDHIVLTWSGAESTYYRDERFGKQGKIRVTGSTQSDVVGDILKYCYHVEGPNNEGAYQMQKSGVEAMQVAHLNVIKQQNEALEKIEKVECSLLGKFGILIAAKDEKIEALKNKDVVLSLPNAPTPVKADGTSLSVSLQDSSQSQGDPKPERMTVAQLKVELDHRGLSKTGRRAELVARLEEDIENDSASGSPGSPAR